MSRTKGHGTGHVLNGRKGNGFEYWSRRPGPRIPGKKSKKITHSMERVQRRALIKSILEEVI